MSPLAPDPAHTPSVRAASPASMLGVPPAPDDDDGDLVARPDEDATAAPPADDAGLDALAEATGTHPDDLEASAGDALERAAYGEAGTPEPAAPELEQTDRYRALVRDVIELRRTEAAREQLYRDAKGQRRAAEEALGEFAREGYGDPSGVLRGTGIKVTNRQRRRRSGGGS